jgi:zinc dependent phospholipase C
MPAFLTHWRILIETARCSQDAGSDLGSLIIDTASLFRRIQGVTPAPQTTPAGAVWYAGPLPRIDFRFPGSDISAMAYLGALAPDITTYQRGHFRDRISNTFQHKRFDLQQTTSRDRQWAKLLHTNRSGDLLLALLELIAVIPSPALRSQALAFAMGYLSHIATDIALAPCINALANAYQAKDIPGLFVPLGTHFYVELCLDEYVAEAYFAQNRYGWVRQPWGGYIEPVAQALDAPTTFTAQVLDLLSAAAEVTYGLSEEQSKLFRAAHLAGLERLRLYLAGRGTFRWLTLNARLRKRVGDPVIATIGVHQHMRGIVTFERVTAYAIRLSERLCRRAISYYASLRNTQATASERNQRRVALRDDLRNWDLSTGYTLEVSFEQEITLRFLHNWIHFAELWNSEPPSHVQHNDNMLSPNNQP